MASDALLPAIAAFSGLVLMWISSTIYMSYQFYCTNAEATNQDFLHPIRNTTLSYLVCYCTAYIGIFILSTLALSDVTIFYSHNSGYKVLIIVIILCGCMGYLSFYLFAISRLYYSFKNSNHPINTCRIIRYSIITFIVTILLSIYAISYYIFKNQFLKKYNLIIISIALTGITTNFYIATDLIYTFTKRLSKIMASSIMESENQSKSAKHTRINLINIATKHCLLNSIALIIFNFAIPINIAIYVLVYKHNVFTYLLTVYLGLIFHTMELFCILLGFSFNQQYYSYFCKFCRNGCNYYCYKYKTNHENRMKSRDEIMIEITKYQNEYSQSHTIATTSTDNNNMEIYNDTVTPLQNENDNDTITPLRNLKQNNDRKETTTCTVDNTTSELFRYSHCNSSYYVT